jgi:uncharacterized protein (DUF2141 family)
MKTLLISFVSAIAPFFFATVFSVEASAQTPTAPATNVPEVATHTLTVRFTNLIDRTGTLYVGLANSEASFNGESFRKTQLAVPASGPIEVQFAGLPAGTYAVRVYQDLNTNGKLDYEGRMPAEPFGFSTIKMLMGPPSFEAAAFELTQTLTVEVRMMRM